LARRVSLAGGPVLPLNHSFDDSSASNCEAFVILSPRAGNGRPTGSPPVTSLQQSPNEARSILAGAARLVRPGLVSDGRVAQQVLRELRGGKLPPARSLLHGLEVVSRCSEPRGVVTK